LNQTLQIKNLSSPPRPSPPKLSRENFGGEGQGGEERFLI